ncbi:hypothetical protein [Cyanobacterium aponinum]|uniref:Uncharacterized protein n=1 Tax=Cyanobacterium aponinum 0216 TaxID=2676140 RepID=A0A844GVL7_9CHRO|nr:hypothetical protein [Cyanobacterium aponinum]MTF40497.1 hypothetical protein [Cyanobacterium aponinum 0216]
MIKTKKLGILTIHGMGETESTFSCELENLLKIRLKKFSVDVEKEIHFESIYYQPVLQDNQYNIWNKMQCEPSEKLRWLQLRKFFLFAFSDAVSLEHKPKEENSVYKQTQKIIVESLRSTKNNLQNSQCPLIVIAQSLGCQVISNYIWDSQKEDKDETIWDENSSDYINPHDDEIDFLKLKTMKFLFTSGCNIPIFVAGFDNIQAFKKPNSEFQWKNYYDKDDCLGWPLQPLSEDYNKLVEDFEIDTGNVFSSWTPLSHGQYWTDRDFVNPIVDAINEILKSS